MSQILALDFGGTKLTAAVVDTDVFETNALEWAAHERFFSPHDTKAALEIEKMITMARMALKGEQPLAVGVSFGGPVDFETGTVVLSHHVPDWASKPLQQLLEAEFAVPVRVDNDANAAALGEWRFGSEKEVQDLFFITVSTGVGGGWILGGRPFRGHGRMAGEIGHTVVAPNGPLCLCGNRGCIERMASGPYLARDLVAAIGRPGLTGKDVAELAEQGEPTAVHLLERSAWALGVGIGNTANLLNPQRFVIGGGVSKSGEKWWRILRETADETALSEVDFDIVPSTLGDDAPLWGAVALVEAVP